MDRLINYDSQDGNTFSCIDCGRETFFETDLLVCPECMERYDTDTLWLLHDNNIIDALDFNENKNFRKQFLKEANYD